MPNLTGAFLLLMQLVIASSMTADEGADPPSGNDLIAAAGANLARLPALEAKLRQRVRLFGHELVGSGIYQQMPAGRQRMMRLELKMDVAGQVTSFQQISNGTTLWIRRDSGDDQSLEYINLRRIRQALDKQTGTQTMSPLGNWFALGGLDQLLHELSRNFEFTEPTPSQIGTVPVWELSGEWKPDALKQFGVTAAEKLPSHLPQIVRVTLGRDQQLPLFPYRIEYGRRSNKTEVGSSSSGAASYVAIAAMDLHGVQHRPDLAAQHFRFQPNEQEVVDVTQRYLSRLIARMERSGDVGNR
ncbi:MAG TPA: hypothetical protein QF564_18270 [Pirellulaceae bacterium]|nr:hypothetical protein [Pirellulaceae bacterium]